MSCQPQYACKGAITGRFGFEVGTDAVAKRGLVIYEGYVECKNVKQLGGGEIPVRGKVVSFSKKSRIRMMKFTASIKDRFQVFQTLTFPDDVMEGKTISERSTYCQMVKRRFLKRVRRRWPDFKAVLRKEWEARKSGRIIGELCPHLHLMYLCESLTELNYKAFCRDLAMLWIDCLETLEREKAEKVNLHPRCFTWLNSQVMVSMYVSKYVAKVDCSEGEQSQGRAWYVVGSFEIPDPEWQVLTGRENIGVRRLLRRYMKRRNRRVAKRLRDQETSTFCFIQKETVYRMIDHVIKELYRNRSPGVVDSRGYCLSL
ncbi:hypothetical protein ES703_65535 [subsurface metagenome]